MAQRGKRFCDRFSVTKMYKNMSIMVSKFHLTISTNPAVSGTSNMGITYFTNELESENVVFQIKVLWPKGIF